VTDSTEQKNNVRLHARWALSKIKSCTLPDLKGHAIFWSLFAAGLVLDLWSKRAVFARLELGDSISVIDGFLRLVAALNQGAAFGIAAGQSSLLIVISVLALVVIVGAFLFGGTRQRLNHVAFGLFAAGVCGNLWDRVFNDGLVRDFIDVTYWPGKHWPAFNVADSLLCIGVGLLILSSFRASKHAK